MRIFCSRIMLNKRIIALLALVVLQAPVVPADFSRSSASLHPRFPGEGPFIIEIEGTWPTDCHPGEQKPVVRSFDGHTAQIEYEIIVVHVTCNDTATPFRSLVDMSDVLRTIPAAGDKFEIIVEFQGSEFLHSFDLVCGPGRRAAEQIVRGTLGDDAVYIPQWQGTRDVRTYIVALQAVVVSGQVQQDSVVVV